jgi:hypothetical protein
MNLDLSQALQPWNLVFLVPAILAVGYLLLMATGLGVDGDANPDLDLDLDGAGHGGSALDVLSLIGVGQAPLSLVLVTFALLWGFLGSVGLAAFGSLLGPSALVGWAALALALVGGGLLTRGVATLLGRFMPTTESYGQTQRQLVGRIATLRLPAGEAGGSAQLYDDRGTLYEVAVRTGPGEPALPSGSTVILWRYDEARGVYLVVQDEAIDAGAKAAVGAPSRSP